MTKPFRCHDADACAGGLNKCPMPWACGCEEISMNEYISWKKARDLPFIKLISECVETLSAKTCCEVNSVDCNQGRDCPVRSGEYKPKEAMHQIQEPSNG